MKHLLNYAFVGVIAATLLSSAATAGTTIDKGALGKYEREGRFVRPVLAASPRSDDRAPAASLAMEGHQIIDKGALGKYERKGRFVRPIIENVQNNWSNRGMKMGARGVKHVHGLNGKEHKNVKN